VHLREPTRFMRGDQVDQASGVLEDIVMLDNQNGPGEEHMAGDVFQAKVTHIAAEKKREAVKSLHCRLHNMEQG